MTPEAQLLIALITGAAGFLTAIGVFLKSRADAKTAAGDLSAEMVKTASDLLKDLVKDLRAQITFQEAQITQLDREVELMRKKISVLREGIRLLSRQLDELDVDPKWKEENGKENGK